MSRSWWVFLLYGLMAIVFGLFALFQPQATMWVVLIGVGVLALGDGVLSLVTAFRKNTALPAWVLLVYAAVSIGFGLLLLFQTQAVATFVIWLLAAWLIVAGLARIVFAVQMRQVIDGKWLLWLSGLVAIALGVWFLFNTNVGGVAIAWWLGIGALVYGVLQVAVAFYLRKKAVVIVG